eukprot:g14577.t1
MKLMEFWMRWSLLANTLVSNLEWLETGHTWLDFVLYSIAPIIIHIAVPEVLNFSLGTLAFGVVFSASIPLYRRWGDIAQQRLRANGVSLYYKVRNAYETTIRFEKESKSFMASYFGVGESEDSEEGRRNNILQKAIVLYIGHLDLDYRRSQTLLTAVKPKGVGSGRRRRGNQVFGGTAEQLRAFDINIAPPQDIWVLVDKENGIWFKQTKRQRQIRGETRDDAKTITIVDYTFQCVRLHGGAKIKAFMNKAFEWYTEEMAATEDNNRYMYSLVATPEPKKKNQRRGGDDTEDKDDKKDPSAPTILMYKRYELGDLKNFDSLFFPQKKNLLDILQNFEAKTDKYALPGYPHKLGLLLHGPPGTGKTSLIKALACKTRRHIIQVPLGRIKTNQDLMNVMFDQSFRVVKEEFPIPLKHKDVIYVFEDVDAATKIVKSRKGMKKEAAAAPSPAKEDAGTGDKDGGNKDDGGDDDEYGNEFDKLDLSGLLNVLDGVVDTPGRIVVVTTNVVDSLDEALIRPGRIDKKILLDYMEYEAALQMTKHFFPAERVDGDLTNDHKRRLKAVFSKEATARRARPTSKYGGASKGKLTPATVEQMLGEHDKVDDFLDALEGLAEEKGGGSRRESWSVRTRVLLVSAALFVLVRAVQKVY